MRSRFSSVVSVLTPSARRRFAMVLAGSTLVSLAETVGMLLIVPLMLLITGADMNEGILGSLYEAFGRPGRQVFVFELAALVVASFLLKAMSTVAFRWWMFGIIAQEQVNTATEILQHYVRMPYMHHLQRGPAELLRTMGDAVGSFYSSVVTGSISVVTEVIGIAGILTALLVSAPWPTVALFIYFAIASLAYRTLTKPSMRRIGGEMTELSVRTFESAYVVLSGIKTIKLRGNPDYFVETYRDARLDLARIQRQSAFVVELPKYIMEVLFILGIGLTTAVVFSLNASVQALGLLALFVTAGFRLLPGITRLLGALNGITVGLPFADLVVAEVTSARELLASSPLQLPADRIVPLPFRRDVVVEGLRFAYADGPEVLRGISLRIPRGSSVAFVGGSGAGKSTLIDLLLGLHTPTSGHIEVDGQDIASDMQGWQANLAMVPQDVYILDRSLRGNVALGVRPSEIDESRLLDAIERAQLSDVVAGLPAGLDTKLGDRGARLSGGQRQRIGIARALYTAPALLVLDEATSALDNITERRIADTIDGLSGEMTVVIVAHRLSTVRHCDQIIHLENGRVAAAGSFDDVQRLSPGFARLVALGRLEGSKSVDAARRPTGTEGAREGRAT